MKMTSHRSKSAPEWRNCARLCARSLRRLSNAQRRALELRIVQERPYSEVASALGISELAARTRVSRGLKALSAALETPRGAAVGGAIGGAVGATVSGRAGNENPLLVIELLGAEFRSLGEPPRGRRPPTRRALLIALALVLVLAGAATAAILITRGAPLPAANSRDLQSQGIPLAATARLAGLDAPDPRAGEPAWDIRLSRTAAGETCTAVGQVLGSQFGIVGLDHVFRALPLGGVDACGVASPDGPLLLAGARVFVGADPSQARTVVNGVAGPSVRSVTVYGPGGTRRLRLGPEGSFITVYRGYTEEVRPRIMVAMDDGRNRAIELSPSYAFEVADPTGRYAWQVSGGADLGPGAFPDENCAQAGELVGRNDPSQFEASLTPIVCGRLGSAPLFVSIRRFVPGAGERTQFPWGNSPSRTLVYGAAAPGVAALTLLGAGPPGRWQSIRTAGCSWQSSTAMSTRGRCASRRGCATGGPSRSSTRRGCTQNAPTSRSLRRRYPPIANAFPGPWPNRHPPKSRSRPRSARRCGPLIPPAGRNGYCGAGRAGATRAPISVRTTAPTASTATRSGSSITATSSSHAPAGPRTG